jgi:hypothetical protein
MSTKDMQSSSTSTLNFIKKGRFYFIYDDPKQWILEDKTKRGLEVREKSIDTEKNVPSDKGMIYDMDGRGHKVNIRWFYFKDKFSINDVEKDAQIMEKKYTELREITCPSD